MEALKMSRRVYARIMESVGRHPPECGGVLGARMGETVTEFYFDRHGRGAAKAYAPDVQGINALLTKDWMPRGVLMVGIVHSHADGLCVPSCGDISYGIRILQALDTVDRFYLPIIAPQNGQAELFCYVVYPDQERQFICRRIEYELCGEGKRKG